MQDDLIMLVKLDGQRLEGEDVATGEHLAVTVTPARAEVLQSILVEAGSGEHIDSQAASEGLDPEAVEPDSPAYLTREGFYTEVID